MKHSLITLLLFQLLSTGFSQNSGHEYTGRSTPAVKKEKLKEVNFLGDITPEVWRNLALPDKERIELDLRRGTNYPQNYIYPQENYNYIIDYLAVEISAAARGKVQTAQSTSDKLSTEQKNILTSADLGTDISIKIKFRYKKQACDKSGSENKIVEGKLTVTVVPASEAEYPGGFKQLTAYLTENIINKVSKTRSLTMGLKEKVRLSEKIQLAIVKFTVNEEGQVIDAKIARTTTDSKLDQFVLEAINKMPKWKPAENPKGIKVKQEFSIPLGGGGGC